MTQYCPAVSLVGRIVAPHRYFTRGINILHEHLALVRRDELSHLILLSGDTGSGKSLLLETFFTQVYGGIPEPTRDQDGITLKAAIAQMPPNPTPKGLYGEVLGQYLVDDIGRDTEGQLKRRAIKLVNACGTETLAIEEVQHLTDRSTEKVWHHVDDIFKVLHDSVHCMVILSGISPDLELVIARNKQLSTRVRSRIHLPRFDWADVDHKAEFLFCLQEFTRHIGESGQRALDLTDSKLKLPFRLYCATGGTMRLLANFLQQLLSVAGHKDNIGLEDFEEAYELFSFKPVLDGVPLRPFSTGFLEAPKAKVLGAVNQMVRNQILKEKKEPEKKTGAVGCAGRRKRK
jgi:hypothetical protein